MKRIVPLISLLAIVLFGSEALAQQMVRLVGNHPANPPAAGVLEAPPDMRLSLSIGFAIKNRADLDAFLEQQYDPSSLWYHRALRKGEFAKRFGPTPTEYRAVLQWLKSEGFEITSDEEPKMYIWCIGTVAQAETAFQIKIVKLPTGAFWNADDPAIPGEFTGLIESVVGLDNLNAIRQQFKSSSGAIGFAPADIASFYSLQPLAAAGFDGTGTRCVALIGISDFLDDAISEFTGAFALPALIRGTTKFKVIFADGGQNPGINNTEEETLLDIEWAHAIAPGAPISAYIGDPAVAGSQSVAELHALQAATTDNSCGAISITADPCLSRPLDPNNPPAIVQQFNTAYATAATQAQGVYVGAGDEGTADEVLDTSTMLCNLGTNSTGQIVNEFAANLNVTAVGGTQFKPNYDSSSNDSGFVPEAVWNQSKGAGGGGISALAAQPSYQKGPGVPVGGNLAFDRTTVRNTSRKSES